MQVPVGFLGKLWSFVSFLPFFLLLLLLGSVKAVLIGPVAAAVIFFGNSAVIIGLWPAHFVWTYYCVLKTERIGLVLKTLAAILLPLPLLLLPVFTIVGSLLGGIGYGLFVPLMATFEAVGEGVADKLTHCFLDGTASTVASACTVVRDVTDFCFHSYFSFMDDLIEKMGDDEKPVDIKLSYLPRSVLVAFVAVPVDILMISGVALWKSPCMLWKGWQRLCEDLVGREGPFLETVCVPFAGLAIVLWPLAVIGGVIASFLCSFFFGFRAGLIAYQEASFQMGLAYMISAIAIYDEYTNDLLYLREGSCLPRPKYRKADVQKCEAGQKKEGYNITVELAERQENDHHKHRRVFHRSKTFTQTVQRLRPIQIWDWFFRSCELNGRILLSEGLITAEDMEECIIKGKGKKLSIKLPAWCILQCLIRSAKSDSHGLLISDDVEVTNFNWPKDKVFEWMLGPLLVIKEQMKKLELAKEEEMCLRKLIMTNKNEKPSDWDDSGFPSDDNIRRGQLQAIIRRLQGITANMSRIPSFRRRFINLVKALYLEAIEAGAIDGSRDVKRRVQADVASQKIEGKDAVDIANSSDDTLGNIDMIDVSAHSETQKSFSKQGSIAVIGNLQKEENPRRRTPIVFLPFSSCLRPLRPRRRIAAASSGLLRCRRDAQDGAGLVHRRHRRLHGHLQRVAAVAPRRLELVRRYPLRCLLLRVPSPLRHRGRRPHRQRHRLRHLQLGDQGRAGAAGELPERDQQLPVGQGAHVLRPLPRLRHLLRFHRLHALPACHGAHAAEVRHLLYARMRAHHRLAIRAQGASEPVCAHDLQGEATIYSGIYWMYGWHYLRFYGTSQLFPLRGILNPSGSGSCLLHHILLSWWI